METDANNGNDYAAKGYSDTNGNYAVAALGITNEVWNCGVNSGVGTPLANYVLNQFGEFTLATNQTVQLNYVALPATSQIHGRVTDNFGNPVSGLALSANANIGGNNYGTLDGNTDNSGNYSLAVANGFWSVQFLNGSTSSDNIDARGYEDTLRDPSRSLNDLLKHNPSVERKLARASLAAYLPVFDAGGVPEGTLVPSRIAALSTWLVHNHLIARPIAVSRFGTNAFLP